MTILEIIGAVYGAGFVISLILMLEPYLKEICEVISFCAAWPFVVIGAGYLISGKLVTDAWKKFKPKFKKWFNGKEN